MDFSKYPKRMINGQTWYFYDGDWVLPIDLNDLKNLSSSAHYAIEKVTHSGENDPKFASSKEAMIVGCYKFLEIHEVEKKVPSDNPGRFIADALYKERPDQDYLHSIGGKVEVFVRLNPLLNRDSKSSWLVELELVKGRRPKKSLENFREIFLNKEIQIHRIEIIEDRLHNSKSYVYHWDFI